MFAQVAAPIVSLLNSLMAPLLAIVGAAGALYCVVLGVKFAKAEEPQDREKAKGALKNAVIGFVLIFVLILALNLLMPQLIKWTNTQAGGTVITEMPTTTTNTQTSTSTTQTTTPAAATDPFDGKTYMLTTRAATSMAASVKGDSGNSGANVEQQASGSSNYQKWKFVKRGTATLDGAEMSYYTIENVGSGYVLATEGSTAELRNSLKQYAYTGSANQEWFVLGTGDGAYYLLNRANSGLAADVNGADKGAGADVRLWRKNNGDSEKWLLN